MDENCRNAKAHAEGARFVQMLEDLGVLAVIHKFAHLPASTSRSTYEYEHEYTVPGMLNFEVVCRYASTFRAYGRCLRAYLPAEVVDGVAACKGGIVRIHAAHAWDHVYVP